MARSEANAIVGKSTYPELNMTQYPDQIDSRNTTDTGYNENMRGFENRKDYNMAEHVNALQDALMAVQRALGIKPFLDKDGVNQTTVSNRITVLESKDYDSRYGGVGWDPAETLVGHTHDGLPGGPSKINLVSEVSGKLNRANLNLDYLSTTSLTAADIAISHTSSVRIDAAIDDKLSTSQGGTVEKNLTVKGKFNTSFYGEADYNDRVTGTGVVSADLKTRSGQSLKLAATTAGYRFLAHRNPELEFGKYVAIVRAKVNNITFDETILRMESYVPNTNGGWNRTGTKDIKSTDFKTAGEYQTFYMVFDYNADVASPFLYFSLTRMGTNAGLDLYFDYLHITPVHPAIYDK